MTRTALVIAHHAGEHAGNLIAPMRDFDFKIHTWIPSIEEEAPLEAPDLAVVLGGVMGANDEAEHPWLTGEIRLVERILRAEIPVVGLCLGGQIVARILGARVYRADAVEFGFPPIAPIGSAPALSPFAANDWRMLQWHQDAFDLPEGAIRLARSAMTPNQAFAWGDNCLALQGHPEASVEMIRGWLVRGRDAEEAAGRDPKDIRAEVARWGPGAERAGAELMRTWLAERFARPERVAATGG